MVVDIFLQFVGASTTGITVVGESVDKAHPETIVVNAVDFSVENPTTIGSMSAGAGAGKAKFNTGAHFPVMKLFVRRAGTALSDYAIYQFNLVFITNIDISADGGGKRFNRPSRWSTAPCKSAVRRDDGNGHSRQATDRDMEPGHLY